MSGRQQMCQAYQKMPTRKHGNQYCNFTESKRRLNDSKDTVLKSQALHLETAEASVVVV